MSRQVSSRLKLITESDDETIDQFEYNWPILDKYADSLSVADGTVPPDTDLYDGCLVSEKTSGKIWIAVDDYPNTPRFKKSWLIYPWQVEAQGQVGMTSAANTVRYFTDGLAPGQGAASDLDANKAIVIPIHGIYAVWYRAVADNVNDSSRSLWTGLYADAVAMAGCEMIQSYVAGGTTVNYWCGTWEFSANQKIAYYSGMFGPTSPCNCKMRAGITLLSSLD